MLELRSVSVPNERLSNSLGDFAVLSLFPYSRTVASDLDIFQQQFLHHELVEVVTDVVD